MRRTIAVIALVAATTTSVVAAPPYEPLPSSTRSSGKSGSSSSSTSANPSSSKPATTYGSGVTTYGVGGVGSDATYVPAVDQSRQPQASSGASAPNWDTYSQVQQMQQELQTLRGMVEQLNHDIDVMRKQERERYLDLDMRINQVRGGALPNADEPVSATGMSGDDVGQDKALYDKASQLRRESKFSDSIAIMEDLLKRSPGGLYAPYCDYWLGEMYMVATPPDYDTAKRHFISLIGNHSDHVKVPDAMYKLGKLFALQGEKSKAKATLNELIKKYPDKSAANLGKDLLKTL